MPTEYSGPVKPLESTEPERERRGYLEYADEPCPACGAPLLRPFVDRKMAGRYEPVRSIAGQPQCRNGCAL